MTSSEKTQLSIRQNLKNDISVDIKIILELQKADKPLIANHIAKGINETPQLVDYHLKNLLEKGVILTVEEYDTTFYMLQPSFYMEKAETSLMTILIEWLKIFMEQLEIDPELDKTKVILNNLKYYFTIFFLNLELE